MHYILHENMFEMITSLYVIVGGRFQVTYPHFYL